MKQWTSGIALVCLSVIGMGQSECGQSKSDQIQRQQQELLLQEATAQTGMPAVTNFRERKLLKEIIELRDQDGLTTYTYIWSEFQAKAVKLCDSIGYGLPYATQYTNPERPLWENSHDTATIPQADPNGLFSPNAAEGTWIMCNDPTTKGRVRPVYVEPRVIVSPFPLN